jgi:hypothetical protein
MRSLFSYPERTLERGRALTKEEGENGRYYGGERRQLKEERNSE